MAWGRLLISGGSWASQVAAASRGLLGSRPDSASWAGLGIVVVFRVPRVYIRLLVHLVLGSISIGLGAIDASLSMFLSADLRACLGYIVA